MNRKYGWRKDRFDERDYSYEKISKAITVPTSVNLTKLCSPIEDQGELGSCTANGIVGALEYLENVEKKSFADLSRLFLYYNERVIEGTVRQDSGAMIRDGIKSCATQGVCPESDWPYNIAKFKSKPTKKCYTEAVQYEILSYHRINTLNDMINCLAQGFPFVFGCEVYESFESDTVAKTGTVPMPSHSEQLLGGHCMLAVGYNQSTKRFIVRNSWGTGWGNKGYCTMPFAYLGNTSLTQDNWTIRKI
jgi:C1A family cysteine protease